MREILFRGQRIDNKEWVYGDLIHRDGELYVFPQDGLDSADNYEVIPETIGQFTGLTDKNRKRIFEGDIIKARHNSEPYKVCFSECKFSIEDCFGNVIKMHQEAIDRFDCEVIGNIHEEVTK